MNAHRRILVGVGASLLSALVACAPALRPAPRLPTDDAEFGVSTPIPIPGIDEPALEEADILYPGDVLGVRYIGDKEIGESINASIDRAGVLHLPLLGDLRIAGRTLVEAEQDVQGKLARFDRFSRVGLSLLEAKGRVATVTGAVERPGNVPIVGDARLADVLASVGGPKLTTGAEKLVALGDVDGTRLVRAGVTLPIDARRALEGAPRHNVRVRAGDVIVVPPALDGRVVVLGHVAKPQTFAYRRGLRLTEVLADCGGLTNLADSEDIRVLRGGYAKPRVFVANAKELLAGVRPDVLLAPGDVVFVTEHWFASVSQVVEKLVPMAATGVLIGSFAAK